MKLSEAQQIWKEALGFEYQDIKPDTNQWISSLGDVIKYDNKFRLFSFDISFLDEDTQYHILESLNRDINMLLPEEMHQQWLKSMKDISEDVTRAVISVSDLRKIRDNTTETPEEGYLLKGQRLFAKTLIHSFYEKYLSFETSTLLKKAFNLPQHRPEKAWGHSGITLKSFTYQEDDDKEIDDSGAFFVTTFGTPAEGSLLIERDLKEALTNAATFASGSDFLTKKQQDIINQLADEGILALTENEEQPQYYSAGLDMNIAKRMVEAGLTIDLQPIIKHHFSRSFAGPVKSWSGYIFSEQDSAEKVLSKVFNIAGLVSEMKGVNPSCNAIISTSGGSSHSGSYNSMTGRPMKKGDDQFSIDDISYFAGFRVNYLDAQQLDELEADLSQSFNQFIAENDLSNVIELDSIQRHENSFSVPFEALDILLRKGLVFNVEPILRKHTASAVSYLTKAKEACDILEEAFGMPIHIGQNFAERIKQSTIERSISFKIEQNHRTTEADFPEPAPIYNELAIQLSQLLQENDLSDTVKVKSSAVRWAGGITGHMLYIDVSADSVDQVFETAEKLKPLKANIQSSLKTDSKQSEALNLSP